MTEEEIESDRQKAKDWMKIVRSFRLEEEDLEEKEANKERIRKLRHEHTPLEKENALEAAREGMAEMRNKTPEERNEFARINN